MSDFGHLGQIALAGAVVDAIAAEVGQWRAIGILGGRDPGDRCGTVCDLRDGDRERSQCDGCGAVADADDDARIGADVSRPRCAVQAPRAGVECRPGGHVADRESEAGAIRIGCRRLEIVGLPGIDAGGRCSADHRGQVGLWCSLYLDRECRQGHAGGAIADADDDIAVGADVAAGRRAGQGS